MNLEASQFINRTPQSISAVFVILAISLQVSLAFYWLNVLQPKLKEEAAANAKIIAESQSAQLMNVLKSTETDMEAAESVMDEILLYQEPVTGLPFFKQISLELDESVYGNQSGLVRGQEICRTCFKVEVALFSPDSFEIVGIAHFEVSDEFFRSLSKQIQSQIITVGVITVILLALAWITSLILIRSLRKETSLRKASEEALEENREKYHRLVSSLSQYFVYTRTPTGDINYSSGAVKMLYGFEPHEMRNMSKHLTSNPINKVAKHYLDKPSAEESQLEFELEIHDKLGESRWLLLSEINIFDESNSLTSVEGLARDITKQKQAEKALVAAKEEAEIASKAKGQFLANMSHEIRTPMNAIIGNCYLMQKTPLSIKQEQFLKRIDSSAHVLLGLVNDVLDLSKIEAGKMELETITFQLDEVLENLSNVVINAAQTKGLDIIFDVEPGIQQSLLGDPLRLGQVILNLVNNAIKFTEKGEILLRIGQKESSENSLVLDFAVKDDGIGIQESKQKMLFQSFNQVDSSMTRKFGGTGLGLAICQHLVKMMQGEIGVESEYGKGSTFKFSAKFGVANGTNKQVSRLYEYVKKRHALVVDDSHTSAGILGNMLQHLGLDVSVAHSGEHALQTIFEKAPQHPIDIIFLDLRMPGLNGIETAQKIKKYYASKITPIFVLVTAHGLSDLSSEDIESLFAALIQKPITESTLINCLNSSLQSDMPHPKPVEDLTVDPLHKDYSDKSVLLVEDNFINQEVALALLQDVGIDAFVANNGLEALDAIKKRSFNVILMDIQMPVMDGLSAARAIRQELKITSPIIAMTAHALEEDRRASEEAGMDDYLTKPIEVEVFYKVLDKWLNNGKQKLPLTTSDNSGETLPNIDGIDTASAMKRVANKRKLFDKLLGEFATHYSDFNRRMQHYLDDSMLEEQMANLHKLKGEAGNISAYRVHEIASAMEEHLRQNNPIEQNHVDQLSQTMNKLLHNINGYLQTLVAQDDRHTAQRVTAPAKLEPNQLEALSVRIMQLEKLLAESALDAIEAGEALIDLCEGLVEPELIQDFASALNQLDFELALELLQKIAQALFSE